MNARTGESDCERQTLAVAGWENEGGAPGQDSMDHQYGGRVERVSAWIEEFERHGHSPFTS